MAHAVAVEPVSMAQFPANREINRDIPQIRPREMILNADTRAKSGTCGEIPYATKQGISSKEQGICTQRTGNLNQPSCDFVKFGGILNSIGEIDAERRGEPSEIRVKSWHVIVTIAKHIPS